ncbi:MAG TPA: transposase [Rickettsia endosymbiont of Pyrocoelia pectoralis]|nr:transposase [Rickettsia endosymbiont of Pyrocoelia pectoralis]
MFALYKYRWAIERLFKHLKTSGFDIEKSHVTQNDRFAK